MSVDYYAWLQGHLAALWEEHGQEVPWEDAGPQDSTSETEEAPPCPTPL